MNLSDLIMILPTATTTSVSAAPVVCIWCRIKRKNTKLCFECSHQKKMSVWKLGIHYDVLPHKRNNSSNMFTWDNKESWWWLVEPMEYSFFLLYNIPIIIIIILSSIHVRIPCRIGNALMTVHLIRIVSLQKMMTGVRSVHPKRRAYFPTRTIHHGFRKVWVCETTLSIDKESHDR
jgi:hypothetical protein